MIAGIALLLLTGLCWVGIAVTVSMAAAAGAGAVGYPVAQGSCIAFFMLYEKFVRRRPMPLSAWGAFVALIAGISLISV